jgi:hypothetical protein
MALKLEALRIYVSSFADYFNQAVEFWFFCGSLIRFDKIKI